MASRIIDPTANVTDLVRAESKYQDGMRAAETRRLNDLASMRVYYDGIIEELRTSSLKLLAEQLKENKADANERMARLEQFRYESSGRGLGMNAIAGWGMSAVMALLAAAMYFKH